MLSYLKNSFLLGVLGVKTSIGKLVFAGIASGMLVMLIGFYWYQLNISDITDSDKKRSGKLERVLFLMEFSEKVQSIAMPPNDVLSHTANYLFGNKDYEMDFIKQEWENKKVIEKGLEEFYGKYSPFFEDISYKNVQDDLININRISTDIFMKMDWLRSLSNDNLENVALIRQEYKVGVILMEEMDRGINVILNDYLAPQLSRLAEEYQIAYLEDEQAQESANLKVVFAVVFWEVILLIVGFIGMAAVGASEEQRRKLQESEEKFRTIVRTATEGFWLLDAELVTLDVNDALCNILGYQRNQLIAKMASKFLNKKTLSLLTEHIQNGNDRSHSSHEVVLTKNDGSEIFTIFNITVLKNHPDTPNYVFAFITDISERTRAEAALLLEKKDMERALSQAAEVLRFLSKEPQLIPYFEASPIYHTSRDVGGGDIVRWVNFRKRYAALYLHDVSGHDIHALLMNILATGITDYHKIDPSKKAVSVPSVFLKEMNQELREFSDINSQESSMFLTAVYVLMDFEKRKMKISLAGHSPAIIICPDGTLKRIGETGPLLGVFEVAMDIDNMYKDVSFTLNEGELLFIHSDGLTEEENENGTPFKNKLLEEVLPAAANKRPEDAFRIVKDAFERYRGNTEADDDVSFVFLGTRPEERYQSYEFLPGSNLVEEAIESIINIHQSATMDMVKEYRESGNEENLPNLPVVDVLEDAYNPIIEKLKVEGWSDSNMNKVALVLHEILMNGIIHGNLGSDRHSVKLSHIIHHDVLEIEVEDKGRGFDGSSLIQVIDEESIFLGYGRGLHLLKEYADRVYYSDSGSTCWALFKKKDA